MKETKELLKLCMFQFTHPRGVRYGFKDHFRFGGVSIHAPARGAIQYLLGILVDGLFQFTHPRGVR